MRFKDSFWTAMYGDCWHRRDFDIGQSNASFRIAWNTKFDLAWRYRGILDEHGAKEFNLVTRNHSRKHLK